MRPAPSPASTPADSTGDRPNRAGAKAARKLTLKRRAQARRVALESMEPRTLLSTIPAPVPDPQIPVDTNGLDAFRTISGGDVFDSSPSIAVDRYNPNKLAATWVTHNTDVFSQKGYTGTPTVVVAGKVLNAPDAQSLQSAVDAASK